MNTAINYKTFNYRKRSDELQYNLIVWNSEFEFITIELNFLKHLIKTYPFQTKIPNLYEHLQLFIEELENSEKIKNTLTDKVTLLNKKMNKNSALLEINIYDIDSVAYEKFSEEVFNYMLNYKNLKTRIYEYISGLID